jgi:cation-transporting ATPase 13A3/4/5
MELEAAMKLSRTDCEQALNFHALFILQNRLKDDTRDSIRSLQMGRINNVMVTGDNDYTAISVARQCNIIAPDRMVFLISFVEDKRNDIERLHYSHVPSSADEEIHSSASQQTEDDFSWSDPNIVVAVSGKAFAYLQNHEISTFKLVCYPFPLWCLGPVWVLIVRPLDVG